MNRPLEIRDVENISLEATDDNSDMRPQLVPKFTCQYEAESECTSLDSYQNNLYIILCCSAVWMINVTHVVVEGISVTVRTPHVSGVKLQQCLHLHISILIQGQENDIEVLVSEFGILAYECSDIEMDSLEVSNFRTGVVLYKSRNTSMINVAAVHNECDGIVLVNSTTTRMLHVSAAYSGSNGIWLISSTDTSMMNVSAVHMGGDGIWLLSCNNTRMINVYAAHNYYKLFGIVLYRCIDTSMINVSAAHIMSSGIIVMRCTNTRMMNVSAVHTGFNGIVLNFSANTSMINVSAVHNQHEAIAMYYSINTSLYYSYTYNNGAGIYIIGCKTTHILYHNTGNAIHIINSTDIHILNSLLSEHSDIEMRTTTNIYITNTTSLITAYNTTNIVLNNTLFSNMDVPSTASSTSEPSNLPAVISLYSSILIITDCIFTTNSISSIKIIGSNVTISGKVLFYNNTASLGTVLIFVKNSILITTDYSNIHFQNNHAKHYGGVFYITTEESYEASMSLQDILQTNQGRSSLITSRTECFVQLEGSRSHARLTFINNTAGKGGDVLYGGLVALGYDGDWNCLLSFKNISDMSEQSGLSLISSAPSRVCLCSETGQPDCLTVADPETRVIYPGQTITIPAVVMGQDFGTVNGFVFAQFLHTPYTTYSVDMNPRHSIAVEHSQCSDLVYTIFSKSEESAAVLVLTHDNREISHLMTEEDNQEITNTWEILSKQSNYTALAQDIICDFINFDTSPLQFSFKYNQSKFNNRTIEDFYKFTSAFIDDDYRNSKSYCKTSFIQTKFVFPKEIYSYSIYINISFRQCPPGFSLSKDPPFRCDCNQLMKQLPGVKCHIQDQTISRSGLVWISTDDNETVTASNCPYNYCNREEINMTLEESDSQCNLNHSGTLCGGCQPGLSLALGTNQCLHCPNTHLALLLPFALAGVVLVCFIKVIDQTLSQGTLNGLIFYANIVKANEYLLYNIIKQTNPLAVFIAWLNLDFGIETCFFNGLTAYGKIWLQFVFPLYIWSIAGLIIITAKYSDRVAKVMGNNSVPVLATLFLLSYAKLFRTIITALSFTMLSTTHGSKAVWSADGNLDYLGPEHAPLFAVAAAALLFLWLPYTLLLFLGQWLHRCNCRLITRMMMKIKPFLDAHYGPLKGYHRYWFGALLLVKAIILLISALIPANRANITVFSIAVCACVLTGFAFGVYKSFAVATFNAVWFINLGLLSISHMFTTLEGGNISIGSNIFFGLAFAQFIALVFYKVLVIIKRSERLMLCLRRGQPEYDDWELYEQAALQREMESDSEREESEESGSIESLPTYGY